MSYRSQGHFPSGEGPASFSGISNPGGLAAEGLLNAFRAVGRVLGRQAGAALRWYRINRTIDELSRLDDHVLKDIGVQRGSIEELARSLDDRRAQFGAFRGR